MQEENDKLKVEVKELQELIEFQNKTQEKIDNEKKHVGVTVNKYSRSTYFLGNKHSPVLFSQEISNPSRK